jgi:transcription antitermination factor NusG
MSLEIVHRNVVPEVPPFAGQPGPGGNVCEFPATPEVLAWYGIHVKSRCESRVHQELSDRGFETFLPMHREKRRWSDRTKTIDVPLFPGYLFCKFELTHRFRILNAPGVARILGAGSTPIPISEAEIRSVEALVASRTALVPWPFLQIGQRVRIAYGPLAGVEGIVARAEDGRSRVVVSVTMLQRAVAAEIDREWIGGLAS